MTEPPPPDNTDVPADEHLEAGTSKGSKTKEGYVGSISTWWKVAYGLPGFATTSLSFLIAVYAVDFYVLQGVDLAFLSFFTALARSFDVITDPIMGWFSDKTRTRFGRRRPFMLTGSLFYALLFVALFTPPENNNSGDNDQNKMAAYWFGMFYTTFYLFDTYSNVPYEALGPELSDDYNERNNIFFVAKLFNYMGMLFAAAAPAVISFFLRQPETVLMECGNFYSATHPPGRDPLKPQYFDGTECHTSSFCRGSAGRLCFRESHGDHGPQFLEIETENLAQCEARKIVRKLQDEQMTCLERMASPCETMKDPNSVCLELDSFSVSNIDAQRRAFFICAAVFGIYYVVTVTNCVCVIRERKLKAEAAIQIPLVPSILRAFKNRAFRPLLVAWALDGLALASLVTMFPFFIRYVVVSDGLKAQEKGMDMEPVVCMGLSVMGLLLAAVLSAPLWLALGKRFGKYYAWMIFNVVSVVTNLLFFIPAEGDPVQTIVVMIVNGIPLGGQFLTNSVLADVIDYDEFLNGSRSEGSFSVFATLIPKFVAIPASALPLAAINLLGFDPPKDGLSQPQASQVKWFIRMTFVLLPLLSAALGTWFKVKFPIKKQEIVNQIQLGIAKHQKVPPEEHTDPITGKSVGLMELSEEENQIIWLYENFSSKCLKYLIEKNTAQPVVIEMGLYFSFGVVVTVGFLVATVLTMPLLSNPKISVIPIASVILFGMSLSFTLVNLMRFLDSIKLTKGDFEKHANLIQRLSRVKLKGQRGGSIADDRPLFAEVIYQMWYKERLEQKYGNIWRQRLRHNQQQDERGSVGETQADPLPRRHTPPEDSMPISMPHEIELSEATTCRQSMDKTSFAAPQNWSQNPGSGPKGSDDRIRIIKRLPFGSNSSDIPSLDSTGGGDPSGWGGSLSGGRQWAHRRHRTRESDASVNTDLIFKGEPLLLGQAVSSLLEAGRNGSENPTSAGTQPGDEPKQ